jgi:catechol 2,3-dioxygenase-like lactoylglutathione lyase family enzyme
MSDPATSALPNLAEVLTPLFARVAEAEQPLLLALAERLAADRYRRWAAEPALAAHRSTLLACAGREDEIARRAEALFPRAEATQREILAKNPDLTEINRDVFADRPLVDQLAIQSAGERVGSAAWQTFAGREPDASRREVLLSCSPLEEENARALDAILVAGGTLAYALSVVRIFVTDWERAIRFYTETLGMPATSRSDEFGWAELGSGEAKLALERSDPTDPEARELVGRFLGVSLRVSDIWTTHKVLAARGVEFVAPPEKQPWGGVLAHLRDPDGNVLTLLGSP